MDATMGESGGKTEACARTDRSGADALGSAPITRARMLSLATATLAAGAGVAQTASALAASAVPAQASEAEDELDNELNDASAYDNVAEDIPYESSGQGIAPYAVPQVTYADERAENVKRVLVVVDYQVDFVDGGVFGTIEPAVAIEDAVCAKIQEYFDRGDIVIYTMDTHPADEYDLTREATVNPPHCDPATEGWHVYGRARELLEGDGSSAILVKKGTYGSMDLPRVIQGIRNQGTQIESIEFAGVSTTCRVLHNAIICYNAFPELPIIMDEATTASYTDERTAEQLEELEAWGFVVRRQG
jgi:nicotinamidase/pyrazinamidase